MPEPENNRPENQPPQPAGKPYSVRRVNNVPLVIGFCLVAAFVAIVFLVVLPSNDSARKETKTKIVSAEGEAAAINAGAPSGFVPARSAPTPPAPVPTPEPIAYRLPSVLQPTPDDRLTTLKQALSFRTRSVNIEHPVAYQAAPAATPQPVAAPAPENYGALLARARALQQGNGTPEEKKEATALGNALATANYGADNPDRWYSPNQVENPVRFQLRAGFVIPAVLLSGVNSEVPGTIIKALVSLDRTTPTSSTANPGSLSSGKGSFTRTVGLWISARSRARIQPDTPALKTGWTAIGCGSSGVQC